MKKVFFAMFDYFEQHDSFPNRVARFFKQKFSRKRANPDDEADRLKKAQDKIDIYRNRYNRQVSIHQKVRIIEKLENGIQKSVDVVIALLAVVLVFFLLNKQFPQLHFVQRIIDALHGRAIILCFIVAGLKLLQIKKYYYEFKIGYGERMLHYYLKQYLNNP